jgi:hypothetical protein
MLLRTGLAFMLLLTTVVASAEALACSPTLHSPGAGVQASDQVQPLASARPQTIATPRRYTRAEAWLAPDDGMGRREPECCGSCGPCSTGCCSVRSVAAAPGLLARPSWTPVDLDTDPLGPSDGNPFDLLRVPKPSR